MQEMLSPTAAIQGAGIRAALITDGRFSGALGGYVWGISVLKPRLEDLWQRCSRVIEFILMQNKEKLICWLRTGKSNAV